MAFVRYPCMHNHPQSYSKLPDRDTSPTRSVPKPYESVKIKVETFVQPSRTPFKSHFEEMRDFVSKPESKEYAKQAAFTFQYKVICRNDALALIRKARVHEMAENPDELKKYGKELYSKYFKMLNGDVTGATYSLVNITNLVGANNIDTPEEAQERKALLRRVWFQANKPRSNFSTEDQ